jgi:hypothetical protein
MSGDRDGLKAESCRMVVSRGEWGEMAELETARKETYIYLGVRE